LLSANPAQDDKTLRLLWPQWQGAAEYMVAQLTPGIPLEQARRGYSTGTAVLQAILPAHRGPTATVPVTLDDEGTQHQNGVDAKDAVLRQLDAALRVIDSSGAERILTLGGECSVSVGPFASLAAKYGEDLVIVWVDSPSRCRHTRQRPSGLPRDGGISVVGHGDSDIVKLLRRPSPTLALRLPGCIPGLTMTFPILRSGTIHVLAQRFTRFDPTALGVAERHRLQSRGYSSRRRRCR
jgi:arginase